MKKIFTLSLVTLFSWLLLTSAYENESGKAGYTGSPGETTCSTLGCHNAFAPNTQGGSVTVSAPGMTDWQYVPGETYTISVTVEESKRSLFGFGFEALTSSNDNAGNLIAGAGSHILTRFVQGVSRRNVTHQLDAGATSDSHTFTFTWEAPATDMGNITFYCAGNAANGNGTTSGDHIYSTSQVITPANTVGINELANRVELSLFPNPAKDLLNVRFGTAREGRVDILLYDTMGRRVMNVLSQELPAGDHAKTADISALPRGQYIAHVSIDGDVVRTEILTK